MLGVFTRKQEPAGVVASGYAQASDPAAAEREEIQSLLGHKPGSNGIV